MSNFKIAFLGLGLMGSGMAQRLLGAGFPVTVYNRSADKAARLSAAGARVAGSPREAADGADLVIGMVSDDSASRATWLGEDGALAGVTRGTLLVESSTVTVGWVDELAGAAQAHGCALLDAPVTGSRPQAASGDLTFLVGGPGEALEAARPALAAMSRAIVWLGPSGSGARMKLINNFLCGVQAASLAEALALVERSGLDREKALEVLTGGAPGSPMVRTISARMAAQDYTPNFLLRLMAKDLTYALAEGERFSLPLMTAVAALEVFQQAVARGYGEQDLAAVVEPLRKS